MEHRESLYCDSLATQNSTENRLMLSYNNLGNKDQNKVPEVPPIIRLPGCPMRKLNLIDISFISYHFARYLLSKLLPEIVNEIIFALATFCKYRTRQINKSNCFINTEKQAKTSAMFLPKKL